jgi:hypothetical protein
MNEITYQEPDFLWWVLIINVLFLYEKYTNYDILNYMESYLIKKIVEEFNIFDFRITFN